MIVFDSNPYEESNSAFNNDKVVRLQWQSNTADSDANIEERDRKPKLEPDIDGAKAALSKLKPEPRKGRENSVRAKVRQLFVEIYECRQLGVKHSQIQEALNANRFALPNGHSRNYYNQLERELKDFVTEHATHLWQLKDVSPNEAVEFVISGTRIPITEVILHDLLGEVDQAEENPPTDESQTSSNSLRNGRDPRTTNNSQAAIRQEFKN